MFLFIKKQGCNIEIADEPKVVWKIVHVEDTKIWRPLYFGTSLYSYNREYEACEHLEVRENDRIYNGFHAFRNPDKAVEEKQKILRKINQEDTAVDRSNIQVLRCIIPEGSEYCCGENDQIVSSCILVFRDDKILETYLQVWGTEVIKDPIQVWLYTSWLKWDLFNCSWKLGYRCNREYDIKVLVYEKQQNLLNQIPMYAVIPEGTRIKRKNGTIETGRIIVFSGYKKFKKYMNNKID